MGRAVPGPQTLAAQLYRRPPTVRVGTRYVYGRLARDHVRAAQPVHGIAGASTLRGCRGQTCAVRALAGQPQSPGVRCRSRVSAISCLSIAAGRVPPGRATRALCEAPGCPRARTAAGNRERGWRLSQLAMHDPENPRLIHPPGTAEMITDDLDQLLEVLPPHICDPLQAMLERRELLEVVMDLGREPEARLPGREVLLSTHSVREEDIEYVVQRIGVFGDDNRAGIERTLHRISAIRNREGRIVGITCRVGRAAFGTVAIIRDIVESGRSILMMGRPGVGKTTLLREAARVLADDLRKRVMIVDTSNEIGGDGDIPHPAVGRARRMQVPTPAQAHAVMIEAVENHMPEVIVIDEIGTELEAAAARTIAERGVQLVATAHGNTLENLMMNPTLSDLIGGIQSVTLSDEEARRRGTQKTVLERKAPPTFDVVVEIVERDNVIVHGDVAETVDAILRGHMVPPEARWRDEGGEVQAATKYDYRISETAAGNPAFATLEPFGGFGTYSRGGPRYTQGG